MFLSDLSIKRPIMMSMFLIVFLLFGGIAYFSMNLNLTPDVDIPYVTVQTVYAGAGPREIETQISAQARSRRFHTECRTGTKGCHCRGNFIVNTQSDVIVIPHVQRDGWINLPLSRVNSRDVCCE